MHKKFLFVALGVVQLVATTLFAQVLPNGRLGALPMSGGYFLHDPSTMVKNGASYFIYGDGNGIAGITSTDLRNWSYTAAVFPGAIPAWLTNAVPGNGGNYFWAPDVAYFNGVWHVYYAYSVFGTIDSVIGVATSPTLTNAVWTDQGKVVQSDASCCTQPETDTTSFNCIDPAILVDTNGSVWMAFGSYSDGILVTQIDPVTGKRVNTNSIGTKVASSSLSFFSNTAEAPFLYQRGGFYYLFLNYGGCCSGADSTYNVRVGRSASPTGPFLDRAGANMIGGGGTTILESTARYVGPGHPGIFADNGTNWFTYHYYDALNNGAPTVGILQLYWSADGWPALTNDWSALYPLASDASESSGLYNGTLQSGATFTNDPIRGNVLYLDGVSNHVTLPLPAGNASTFAAWVNWRGGGDWQRIFDFGTNTSKYFFLTPRANTGVMRFGIKNGGAEQQINAPFALPTNSWQHVAVTLDGTVGILYLNGSPVATNSISIRPWQTLTHSNYLGKSEFGTDPYFAGMMSSFRVFSRALSAAEISALVPAPPALSHRYSFSTNALTYGWDSVGMAHGTLAGNAVVTNNALKLTGASGGYANLPGGLVSGSTAVTLEFWATFGVNGNWARVFDTGNINGNFADHYFFFSPHNGLGGQRMEVNTSSATTFDIAGITLDNRTVHVAAICDPANSYMAVYTNGVLEASSSAAIPALSGVANAWSFIGRSLWSADAYLNGTIDELRLYDGRLAPQQIAANDVVGPNLIGAFDVWTGLGTNANWSTSSNWITAKPPNASGDDVFFAGTTGLAPNLNTNFSVASITFATNCGSFTLGTTNGSTLTLASGATLVNNSTNAQNVNVPLVLTSTATFNTAPGNLIFSNSISGGASVTKTGSGALLINGTLGSSGVTVSSGTLGGNGRIGGNILIQPGSTFSPGTSIGRLVCSNNLTLAGTTLMEVSKTAATNDSVSVTGALTYGGTLTITNLSGTMTGGESFPLFTAGSKTGSFTATNLPTLNTGLSWNFNPASGVLTVIQTVATNPTDIYFSVSGGNLTLNWPADHTGWRLQAQTNAVNVGLGTNWIEVAGSSDTNSVTLPVDANNGSVFYRLTYP